MKKLMVVLMACACGPGGTHFIEPAGVSQRAVMPGSDAVACAAICEQVKPQLIRDFAVLPQSINCADFNVATTCRGCDALFQSKFGVQLTQCP
ncbi:MAG: hypothetical protein JNM17_19615 [Archangium sp.]|nr:hypothetical protein [Archangium sp.]